MKTRILRLCLFAAVGLTNAWSQTTPPIAGVSEEAQKFLNAPVWYFNYTVTIKLRGTHAGAGTESSERTIDGRMLLGLRSQGPSLSVITGEAKPPDLVSQLAGQQAQALANLGASGNAQAAIAALSSQLGSVTSAQVDQANAQLDAYINNYANWISGVNIDETKTDEENERLLLQVREQNFKPFERFRWQYSGPGSAGGHDRGSANGSGLIMYGAEPAVEIDGANRKFKLLFELHFTDSLQTANAFQGIDEKNIGTIHYQRFEIKTGLHSGEQPITQITPEYKFIEGRLPNSFGPISGQSVHSITKGGLPGTLSIQYVLSPNAPIPVELWIDPPANYQRWLPTAKDDEKTAADIVPIKIVLQKPGGGAPQFKPMRYEFYLLNTSREKGICLNWPPPPASGTSGANDPPLYDLQFESARNPDMLIDYEGQRLVETAPTMLEREVNVSCFDYGAYGEFAVRAVLANGQTVEGIVRGTTDQKGLKLPACKDGSKIATAFLDDHGVGNLADDNDEENDPVGDGFKGDGFTLYEEYRGFMHGKDWTPLNPKKKDVFVLNLLRSNNDVTLGIKLFESATGLQVHSKLFEDQVLSGRTNLNLINYNHTAAPHLVDQHVIRIVPGLRVDQGATYANALNIGTPGKAKAIIMPPDLGQARGAMFFATTVAHEMLHCVNVFHHGERDELRWWYYTPNQNPADQMFESDAPQNPNSPTIPLQNRVHITVKTEAGTVVSPSTFFRTGVANAAIDMGLPHGQHSGAEYCLTRYAIAVAYPSNSDPSVRYLTEGEPVGFGLCNSRNGTGVNGSRSPQSRYSWAALPADGGPGVLKDRGNCAGQIRVSDKPPVPDER